MTAKEVEAAINRYSAAMDRERAAIAAELEAATWHCDREIATMRALLRGEPLDALVLSQILSLGTYLEETSNSEIARQKMRAARADVLSAFAAYRPVSPDAER